VEPQLWRRRLVRQPLRYRFSVEDLPPGELVHQSGVVAVVEEFLVNFEVGFGDVFERHCVLGRVVGGARQEYAHDPPRLPQRLFGPVLALQPVIDRQEDFVGRAGERL